VGKEKLAYVYQVGMAYWQRTRIDSGWSRKNSNIRATSRVDAVQRAAKILGYEYLPPAKGSKGRYFLLLCGGRYYVCRALDAHQAYAYVSDVLKKRSDLEERDRGFSDRSWRPLGKVWSITAVRKHSTAQRVEAGLPPLKIALPPEPWECERCHYQDYSRDPSGDADEPCHNCGQRPKTDEELLEEVYLQQAASHPPLVTSALFPP